MRHALTRTLALCALMLAAGCASSGTSRTAFPPGYKGAVLLSTGTHPDLRFPSGSNSIDVNVEVMVDANGAPDLKTLKLSGYGAEDNRDAVQNWLMQLSFSPASVNNVPVAGPYRVAFRVKRSVVTKAR